MVKIKVKNMKSVFASKTVWFNVIMTIVNFGAYFQTVVPANWLPYAIGVQALGTIVLRIWFTSATLTLGSKKA